jgi:hypothetical protein
MGPGSLARPSRHESGGGRRQYRPIAITSERSGVLRRGLLDLTLSLTSAPDTAWIRAFDDFFASRALNSIYLGTSSTRTSLIHEDKITLSISESNLKVAWSRINACVDHANAVSRRLFLQRIDKASASGEGVGGDKLLSTNRDE